MAAPRYQGAMLRCLSLFAILALAACGSEPGPGGATAGEAKALDDAAEMIESRRMPQAAVRPPADQQAAASEAAKP